MATFLFDRAKYLAQGYTNEELDKYLQEQRAAGKNINVIDTTPAAQQASPPSPQGRSLLANALPILGGVAGGVAGEALMPLGGGIAGGAAGMGLGEAAAEALSGQKLNPKDIALNAAMGAVPFGKGAGILEKALLPGAGVGALSALTQDNPTPQSVLNSATTGAVGAGVLSKVLPIAGNLLGKTSEGIDKGIVNPQVPAGIRGAAKESELMAVANKRLPITSADTMYKALGPANDQIVSEIQPLLKGKPITTNKVLDTLETKLKDVTNFDETIPDYVKAKNKFVNQILDMANKNGPNGLSVSIPDLYNYNGKLDAQLSRAFRNSQLGQSLSPKEEVAMATWDTVKELMPKPVNNLMQEQSALHRLSGGLKAAKESPTQIPLVGRVPFIKGPIQDASAKVSAALDYLPNKVSNLPPNLQQALVQGQGQIAGRGASILNPQPQEQQDQSMAPGDTTGASALTDAGVLGQTSPTPERTVNIKGVPVTESQFKQAYVNDLAAGGKNRTLFEGIIKSAFPDQTGQASDKFIQSASDNIKQIANNKVLGYGPLQGRAYSTLITAGQGAPQDAIKLNEQYTVLKLNILRAYNGARISDADFKLAEKYIPNIWDSSDQAKTKLQVLNSILLNATPPDNQTSALQTLMQTGGASQ